MTAPRKTATKKQPAKRVAAASVAARREVRNQKTPQVTYNVKFRGDTFELVLDKLATEKLYWREKAVEHYGNADAIVALMFEILGQRHSGRFINLMKPGDDLFGAASEFMAAFRKASADPN